MTDTLMDGNELAAWVEDALGAAGPPGPAVAQGVAAMAPSKGVRPKPEGETAAHLPAYQGLRDPAPAPPNHVIMDISPMPWDGSMAALGEAGREGIAGPPVL